MMKLVLMYRVDVALTEDSGVKEVLQVAGKEVIVMTVISITLEYQWTWFLAQY
jgi:hypothetical protein